MHLVEFVAIENITREIETDLTGAENYTDASEMAIKGIKQMYPEFEDVEVVSIKEI